MLRNGLSILCVTALTLGLAEAATYTSFSVPGAASTVARGINADGAVVGNFTDSAGKVHGFLLSGGTFTTIDYPGALTTVAWGINNEGDIVGTHTDATGLPGGGSRGFRLRQGTFTDINYPGHLNTIPRQITDAGVIVGCYHDTDTMGTMHGFVYLLGSYSALDGSWGGLNTAASMNNGVMPDGNIVAGLYTDMMTNTTHGYLAGRGVFAPFDFPFSIATMPYDMNGSGEVVGFYRDADKKLHGFLLELGDQIATVGPTSMDGPFTFRSIDFPGATATQAFGINSKGEVVGLYTDGAGKNQGFVLTRGRRQGGQ